MISYDAISCPLSLPSGALPPTSEAEMNRDSSAVLKAGTLISGADVLQSVQETPPPGERGGGGGGGGPSAPALEPPAMALPSGRQLAVVVGEGGEELRVHGPDGAIEVTITLTDAGPVVRLSAARLELSAAETVAIQCADFQVEARSGIQLACAEDLRLQSRKDVFVEGAVIWLN